MKEHQLDPDFFPMLEESSERNRIINWSRKTHDIMHLVAGYGSDLGEEIGWQAFYSANTQSPLGMVVVAMGIVHLALFNPDSLLEHLKLVTEAYERGKLASSLLDFNWEQNFDKPIEQVRSTLRLVARKSQVSSLTKKSDISY
jgi:ubiquinone biosynthesis protein COQ4